jgi:hypothetical protein
VNRRLTLVAGAAGIAAVLLLLAFCRARPLRPAEDGSPLPPGPGEAESNWPSPRRESASAASTSEAEVTAMAAMDAILKSGLPEDRKAQELLGMIPTLAPAAQRDALAHALHLLPDAEFSSSVRAWIAPAAPRALGVQVLADAANRPDAVKLPLLLEILRLPNHPLRTEARLMLLPYVGIARVDDPEAAARAVAERLAR